jgi:PTH1 family peptidyl-tRNA hydrolase
MKLIVGLGNPGKEYAGTRHNVGFEAVGALAASLEATFKLQKDFKAEIAEARIGTEKVLLAKPVTFMNLSGEAVRAIASFYKIPIENVLLVHDEMDYVPGLFAFSIGSGPAGHNGVESVQEALATKEIARLRIGVGRPTVETKENYVLGRPSAPDRSLIDYALHSALSALRDWSSSGLDKAMNLWNGLKRASS